MADEAQPLPDDEDTTYETVREFLGPAIGQTILEITQHDADEWREEKRSYVQLHLSGGGSITFPISDDGVSYEGLD